MYKDNKGDGIKITVLRKLNANTGEIRGIT